jgi:predicted permease
MPSAMRDLRFTLRSFRRRPGFVAVALVTVGLGIGANVAIFGVVHAVLLRPLPYQEPDRVVHIMNRSNTASRLLVAPRDVVDYREQANLFEAIEARGFTPWDATLRGGDRPLHIRVMQVTNGLFSLLGFDPVLGRTFRAEDATPWWGEQEDDTVPPTPPGTILSHGLWQHAFGGDPGIIGRTVEIQGISSQVVGVMPADFRIVPYSERAYEDPADVWFPFFFDFGETERRGRSLIVYGRLKPDVTVQQAQSQMDAVSARLQEQVAAYKNEDIQVQVLPAHHDIVKGVKPALLVLTGAVGFLLLLSCANLASLLLVRGRGRLNELSVRAALGSSRRLLAQQTLTESLVLSAGGGLVGLGLGWLAIQLLLQLKPANLPRIEGVSLSGPVIAFSLGAVVLAALLSGLLPAIQAGRINISDGLKNEARGSVGGRRSLLGWLVVVEVAVSVTLLVGAGLMLRTFTELQSIRPGFEPDGVLTFTVNVYGEDYAGAERRVAVFEELQDRFRTLPGVERVGGISQLPLTGGRWNGPYAWDEDSEARWPAARAAFRMIGGDYFQAMGTRLLAGRLFSDADIWGETSPVIIDEKLARETWPDEDPLGKTFIAMRSRQPVEVIGVVEHQRHRRLERDGYGAIYFPFRGVPNVVVRASGDPAALTGLIREEVRGLDPGFTIYNVATMRELVDDVLAPTRFTLLLMGVFAGVALVLAGVGLYGVISYAVRQRTTEIGVRMALGADRGRVLRLVVGRGAVLTAIGIIPGVAGVFALAKFIGSLLYGGSTSDPATLVGVVLLVSLIGLLASFIPARRAARIDPATALRAEQ